MNNSKWNVETFLSQYQAASTISHYRAGLTEFLKTMYPREVEAASKPALMAKINDLSLRYMNEERDIRKDMISFKQSLNGEAPKTITLKLTAVLRFLEDNGQAFPKQFLRNLNGKAAREAISDERVPDNNEIARIVEFLPIHDKALTLLLASSGMRIGEALKLEPDDIDLARNPPRITLRAKNTKTGRKRFTFISQEAKTILIEWLKYRESFLVRNKDKGIAKRSKDKTKRVFPFSSVNLYGMWALALDKTGLLEKDKETNRITLRPHNLRKFFRTRGQWKNPDIAEALMGHQEGITKVYARYDQAEQLLEAGYLEAEPNLSIYANTSTMLQLRDKVERQSDDIQELVTNLSVENVRMRKELDSMQRSMKCRHSKTAWRRLKTI